MLRMKNVSRNIIFFKLNKPKKNKCVVKTNNISETLYHLARTKSWGNTHLNKAYYESPSFLGVGRKEDCYRNQQEIAGHGFSKITR